LQSRLVDDLLDVSRAAAGKMSIDSQLVQVGTLCGSVVELSQPAAREKSIALTLTQKDDPRVWGDPDRLQQVLNNVVSNAIKFSTKGGRVDVQVARDGSRVSVVKDEARACLRFLPHMFSRQADASMTRGRQARAGPTIGARIAPMGHVRAESAARSGTAFFPGLPSRRKPAATCRRRIQKRRCIE
jgi:signal transduction histidine kinase